jgi:multidrug efflux pump
MNISAPFIRRPVATTLLTAAVALAGGIAFVVLPVAPLPAVDFPTIAVSAQLPGASAEIMASSVATPLERQFGHIAGVSEMTSASSLGNTAITIQFDLNRNIDGAARDVEAAINAARTYLPTNLPSNPTYRKVNPSDAPIMIVGLTSDVYDPGTLYDQASTVIEQKLSQIQGVGQVVVGGGALPSVRVDVNPDQLASYGLTMSSVQSVLSLQNADLAKGQLTIGQQTADIVANDQISHAADYRPLVIGYHNGSAVRLADVAQVSDAVQNIRVAGYLNGKRAVPVIIFRQPGANIIETVDRIRAQLPFIEASIPRGIKPTIVLDRTTTIRASVSDVERTLLLSIALVIMVVFVFLRSGRATLIPGVAVPVSLIGTFAVMYLLGYSIDNLSLMALTISTGFVVDDAIVVMENITRHLEGGMSPMDAALKGAEEIGFTVFTISMSLIAVFIPLLMMGGIVGRLFREFAVTLSTSIIVSMLVSLTTTPMMCAYLLRPPDESKQGRLFQASERIFDSILQTYRRTLDWVLDHPVLTLGVLGLTIALNVVVIVKIPKGFFPQQDTGALAGALQGPQDSSFPAMDSALRTLGAVIKHDSGVANIIGFTGTNGAINTGSFFVALKPLSERKVSAMQIINRIRPKMNRLPVASAFLQPVQDLRIGGRSSNALYQYTIQSDNEDDLRKWGPVLLQSMKKLPGLQDVSSDQQNGGLDEQLTYDRVSAAKVGQSVQGLDAELYGAFGQSEVSIIYTQANQYYVVLEVAPQYWQTPAGLNDIYLQSNGKEVPILAVATGRPNTTPLAINHTGLFPSVTVSFNLAPGVSSSDATSRILQMQSKLGAPSTMRGFFAGTLLAYQQSLGTEPLLVLTALLTVYIVLGILYESLVHPLTIISTLPSASVGAMLALMLFKVDLNVISIIGIVLLIGIVKKNAIMMIDFALEAERKEHMSTRDSIVQASQLRFRPILMTTMAALLGALPLALGSGTGSELRRPLGITIVGGLILSQLLTLYTTPVVYLTFDRMRIRMQERSHRAGGALTAAGAVAVLCLAFLTGCDFAPKYQAPAAPTPSEYKETGATAYNGLPAGIWHPAQPQDAMLKGVWWEMFNEPELDSLESQLNINNQTIAQYFQAFMAARAQVNEARAQYFPTLTANPAVDHVYTGRVAATALSGGGVGIGSGVSGTEVSLPIDVSWEPDLWGRVRNTVREYRYAAQVSAADLENERLTEQADLAEYYFELRGQDALAALYTQTIAADSQSLELTKSLAQTGIDNDEAVAQAEVTLKNAEATAVGVATNRAIYEHAIATLIGKPASDFAMPVKALTTSVPAIPVGIPTQLLQRRPDIAGAERLVAEANAAIGVERAAYYPNLSLTGSGGVEAGVLSKLFTVPALFWSLGASAVETIFDGGLRDATMAQYRANYLGDVAGYRQTVLTAFQQVEDYVATLRVTSDQIARQDLAVQSAQRYFNIAEARYQTGLDPYLNVITAQNLLLSDQQTLVTLRVTEMTAAVELIQALGGGWDVSRLPSPSEVTSPRSATPQVASPKPEGAG